MPPYNPDAHHRRSIRLKGYDYASAGAYFLTICTYQRECLFGDVVDGEMRCNPYGALLQTCWNNLPEHYPHVAMDAFVVMPNHVHGVVVLKNVGAGLRPAPTPSPRPPLPEIVRAFKAFSSRRINEARHTPGLPVWQRNYYERIIRDEAELNRVRDYIVSNPTRWAEDEHNPANLP